MFVNLERMPPRLEVAQSVLRSMAVATRGIATLVKGDCAVGHQLNSRLVNVSALPRALRSV